ncbi:hypothetical protein [Thermochromatium tepidum]|nr:hypothetical protein [Thermochromatium tepidum]
MRSLPLAKDTRHRVSVGLGLILLLSATCFIYLQGLNAWVFYDDLPNLSALETLDTLEEAWRFVTEGGAGPLGRPLAQLSFLIHANQPRMDAASDARFVNILIHLANGVLLYVLGAMLLRLRGQDEARSDWIALGAAALWSFMPLLASTTLILIQRQTSLATLFGLIGLTVFVYGYFIQSQRPKQALLIQGLGLGIGTLLAILAKENGALFPVYALVIDAVLLPNLSAPSPLRRLRRGTLSLGLAALLVYLLTLNQDWSSVDPLRGWSVFERLQTEVVLLWQYLYLAFFPQPTAFSPFYDDLTVIRGWWAPTLSALGFLALTLIAVLIRRRTPWPLFALTWFFTGHLLESTVILLELMFEHRNYLAVYGLCLALSALAWQAPGRYARLGPALFGVYTLLMALILYGTTSIWGQPLVAAESWVKRHPNSQRAVAYLAEIYHAGFGDDISSALPRIDRAAHACSDCTDAKLQILLYACGHTGEDDIRQRLDDLMQSATTAQALFQLFYNLDSLQKLAAVNACPPITPEDVYRLTLRLLDNPHYTTWLYHVHTLFHAAYFAKEIGDLEAAYAHLAKAESLSPTTLPILQMQLHLLLKEHRYSDALAAIERRRPLKRDRIMTDAVLDELADEVRKDQAGFETSSRHNDNP